MTEASWGVLVTLFLMVLYIAQGGVVLSALVHLSHAGAKWRADIAPYAHRTLALYPLAFVLLLILLAMRERTFPYYREVLSGRLHLNVWHDYRFLATREVLLFLAVVASHYVFVWADHRARRDGATAKTRLALCAGLVPFIYFIYGTMVSWDFEMTLTPGWFSSIYASYFFVSNFQMFLGFFALWLYLKRLGGDGEVIADRSFNYLAQMLLGLTLLWTYTFFAQFVTIWYGALPEETYRLYAMMFADSDIRKGPGALAPLFWWFVSLKAFVPFGLLIFGVVRHTPALTALVGALILIGTFLERYTWRAGAIGTEHMPLTAAFDILALVVVAGLALAALRTDLVLPRFARPARQS